MMQNKFNIDIFIENIKGLFARSNLKKKEEFSKLIDVDNAFRKDIKSIGDKLFLGVMRVFPEIKEKGWLLQKHDAAEFSKLRFTPIKEQEYMTNNIPSPDLPITELYNPNIYILRDHRWFHNALDEILDSDDKETILALEMNVQVFRQKIRDKKNFEDRLKAVEKELRKEKKSTDSSSHNTDGATKS